PESGFFSARQIRGDPAGVGEDRLGLDVLPALLHHFGTLNSKLSNWKTAWSFSSANSIASAVVPLWIVSSVMSVRYWSLTKKTKCEPSPSTVIRLASPGLMSSLSVQSIRVLQS